MLGKFNSPHLAQKFSENTRKMSAVIMGDDGKFWVVTMAKMEELIKVGYEVL